MCEESDLAVWERSGLTRRQFSALGAGAALAACAPTGANGSESGNASDLVEAAASFATRDGTMDGVFIHPAGAKSPGVLFWPDIGGLRAASVAMGRRLAGEGYAVLVVNPYYRDVAGEQFVDFADFAEQKGFAMTSPWREKFSAERIMHDAAAAIDWLDAQAAVDTARGVGTQGYCMGGPFTIWSAAAAAGRVRAAASFHGAGLVREGDPMSPHAMLGSTQARFLIAIAQNDDARAPNDKVILREAADKAGVEAEIEVYPADHGWTVPDSPTYDQAQAERAWASLLALYSAAL